MKTLRCLLGWIGIATAFAEAPRLEFVASAGEVAAYDYVEITVTAAQAPAGNPFTDVSVTGTFARQGAPELAVDGFCDSEDGRVHRIRFMPAEPGVHEYSVTWRHAGAEQTHRGTFTATDGRKRGLLRVDPEYPAHFQWEGTKERYFWNGTTAYWLAGCDDEAIREALDRLDRLKVTRVRAALSGRVRDGQAWFEPVQPSDRFSFLLEPWVARKAGNVEQPDYDVSRFNVAYWRKWERLLAHARAKDMMVSVIFYVDGARPGVDPFGRAAMGGPEEQRYYRYAVARLGAFANVMWDVANEYRLFRDDAWAEKMGAFVKACDPYDHLTSVHGHGDFRFRRSPWADLALYQSWDEHGGYDYMLQNRREQEKTGRLMPQVNEEYGYEDHYPKGWGGDRVAPARSAESRVRLAWEICLAGGYQTTGERANRGDASADPGQPVSHSGGWINGRGEDDAMLELYGHLYDFFTGITWWELHPEPELVVSVAPHPGARNPGGPGAPLGSSGSADGRAAPPTFAARNPAGDLAAVYIAGGGIVTLKDELLKDQLKPLWFSPRDGGMRNARALRGRTYRTPTAEDWVLLFRSPCNCSFRDFDNEFEQY